MCGLVGAAGLLTFREEGAFKHLLQLDTLRGPHSTGVLIVPRQANPTPVLVKELGTPWEGVFQNATYRSAFAGINKLLLGHNRFATKGQVTAENAHPFEFGNITGAHNGTLHSTYELKGHTAHAVDSQSIYSYLSEHGARDTVEKLNGSFALSWYDKSDDTLNFCRNAQRPLWWTRSTDCKTLFWASEEWMLHVALGKHNIQYEKPVEMVALMHYTFNLNNLSMVDMAKPRVVQLKGWSFQYSGNRWDQLDDEIYGNRHRRGAQQSNVFSHSPAAQASARAQSTLPALPPPSNSGGVISQDLLGKQVSFSFRSVVDRKQSTNGAPYIRCSLDSSPLIEVRVYMNPSDRRWDGLAKIGGGGIGRIKKLSRVVGANHVVIDVPSFVLRNNVLDFKGRDKPTVVDLTPPAEDTPDEEFLPIYEKGIFVPLERWLQATARGCCICSGELKAKDAEDLVWICNDREIICPSCVDTPIGKEYAKSM